MFPRVLTLSQVIPEYFSKKFPTFKFCKFIFSKFLPLNFQVTKKQKQEIATPTAASY